MSIEYMGHEVIDSVMEHNTAMLTKELNIYLSKESIGGNAGGTTIDGVRYSCAAANAYTDKKTGKIILFGNMQDVDPAIRNNPDYTIITLQVALDFKQHRQKIVGCYGLEHVAPAGNAKLTRAIDIYNQQNW